MAQTVHIRVAADAIVLCAVVLWSGAALAQNSNVNPTPGALWTYLGATYGAGWTVGSGIYGAVPTAIGHPAVWANTAGTALNMPDQMHLTPTITTVLGENKPENAAILIEANRTGTMDSQIKTGVLQINQVESVADRVASSGIMTLGIDHSFGGTDANRMGIWVNLHNNAPTAPELSQFLFYTGIFSNVSATVTPNATPGGVGTGNFFSYGGQTTIYDGINVNTAVGAEFDVSARAGSSLAEKILLHLVLFNSDAVRGSLVDAGIVLGRDASAAAAGGSLEAGIVFGIPGFANSWPFKSDSIIIQARGDVETPAAAAAYGIDFSHVSFTSCAFISKSLCISDTRGLILYEPYPQLVLQDRSVTGAPLQGAIARLASNGTTPNVFSFQINTAAAGDFSTAVTAYTIDASGNFLVNQTAGMNKGVVVGGGAPGAAPPGNYYTVYTDATDNKLKAMSSTGVVTVLASP